LKFYTIFHGFTITMIYMINTKIETFRKLSRRFKATFIGPTRVHSYVPSSKSSIQKLFIHSYQLNTKYLEPQGDLLSSIPNFKRHLVECIVLIRQFLSIRKTFLHVISFAFQALSKENSRIITFWAIFQFFWSKFILFSYWQDESSCGRN
jgi:hypothetical protein